MSRRLVLSVVLVVVLALVWAAAYAGCPKAEAKAGSTGGGAKCGMAAMWNPGTVGTLTGKVVSVEQCSCAKAGKGCCWGLVVDTGKGKVTVNAGPKWYADGKKFSLKPKDQVVVTGSEVTIEKGKCCPGCPMAKDCKCAMCQGKVVMAKEIRQGTNALTLRDDKGAPTWAGGMHGKMGAGCPMKMHEGCPMKK